jgi:hypothetical protein
LYVPTSSCGGSLTPYSSADLRLKNILPWLIGRSHRHG